MAKIRHENLLHVLIQYFLAPVAILALRMLAQVSHKAQAQANAGSSQAQATGILSRLVDSSQKSRDLPINGQKEKPIQVRPSPPVAEEKPPQEAQGGHQRHHARSAMRASHLIGLWKTNHIMPAGISEMYVHQGTKFLTQSAQRSGSFSML